MLSLQRADPIFQLELKSIEPRDVYQLDLCRQPRLGDIAAITKLRRYLRGRSQPQIVHAHSTKAGAVASMLQSDRTAILFSPHAYRGMDTTLGGWRGALVRLAEASISKRYCKVIVVSPDEYKYARELGIREDRLCLIPNGVNLQEIRDVGQSAKRTSSDNVCDIGFIGRLVHQKDPLTFFKALSVMAADGFAFHGHVVGDGPLRPMLEKYACENGIMNNVTFYGTVKAIPLLANWDVLVHTSIYESCPYSLLEGIALGVPIVAVTNAGSKAIFGERLELIKGQQMYTQIASATMRINRESSVREQIRAVYRQMEKEISIDIMIENIEAEYNDLWRDGKRSSAEWGSL